MSCSSFWIWQRDDAVYNEHSKLTNCTPYIYVARSLYNPGLFADPGTNGDIR